MCSVAGQTNLLLPTPSVQRNAGWKRPRALTLAVYNPAAEERGANVASLSASVDAAGAVVPFMASAVPSEPINAVPLVVVAAPHGAPERTEPWWPHTHLLPHLRLRFNLSAHFVDEKTVTATDLDPHQSRLRLPTEEVWCHLQPILTPLELKAASLLHEEEPRSRPPKQQPTTVQGEKGKKKKKKKKRAKKHGGLPVLVVDTSAGIRELQLSQWESSRGTIIKGEGYLDFIKRCNFKVNDDVEIWAFKEQRFRYFGMTMCDEIPLYVLITTKGQHAKM